MSEGSVVHINTDAKCPNCEKQESVNGGLCLDCITDLLLFANMERDLILQNLKIFNDPEMPDCECGSRKSINHGLCLACLEENLKTGKLVKFKHLPDRWPADSLTIRMAKTLIRKYHAEADGAAVAYLFKAKHTETNGKIKLGSCSKQSPTNKMLHGWDFIIELAWDMWAMFEPWQREALLLHEICHISRDESQWKIEPHNVEEFVKVIDCYGLWKPDLENFAAAIRRAEVDDGQRELFADGM